MAINSEKTIYYLNLPNSRYNSFYEKYAGLPFSKHPQKYLKFKPEDVLSHIESFFDAAA